jgi:hypothetical protein
MPLFISYSHQDRDFVDRLAAELTMRRRHVWVDRWEIQVGESLLTKVQNAITEASALVVVLSRASVASEWCRKELNSGLLRELEEKRVLVLPALIEDCDIPLFLREKKYADFRRDFEEGFGAILQSTANLASDSLGRSTTREFHHDWAIDWDANPDNMSVKVTCASYYHSLPYSVLCTIAVRGNQDAARKILAYNSMGLGAFGRALLLVSCTEMIDPDMQQILIEDNLVATRQFTVQDSKTPLRYDVDVSCRRLGDDSANNLLYDYGEIIRLAYRSVLARSRKPTPGEQTLIAAGLIGK